MNADKTFNNEEYCEVSAEEFETFKKEAASQNKALIVFAGNDKCGNCKFVFPKLKKKVEELGNYVFIKADINTSSQTAWSDVPTDGQSRMMPFIKSYVNSEYVAGAFGADEEFLEELFFKSEDKLAGKEYVPREIVPPTFNLEAEQVVSMKQYVKAKEEATNQGKGIIFVCSREVCGNCKYMMPKVKKFVDDNSSKLVFVQIDIDKCSGVSWEDMPRDGGMLPFIKVFVKGGLVGTVNGTNEEDLNEVVDKALKME